MKFFAITLFPNMIDSYTNESILGRAKTSKLISVKSFQLRDFTKDKHRRTDGKPFGGGPGMVLWVDPIVNAFEKILKEIDKEKIINKKLKDTNKDKSSQKNLEKKIVKNILVVNFVPSANIFTNKEANEYAKKYTHIIFICGRYEGVDARVNQVLKDILNNKKKELKEKNTILNSKIENISIGEYILTGGELPALIMMDSISRQISGVLHDNESIEENRVASSEVYARPEIYEKKIEDKKSKKIKKYIVPKVLLSGNHKEIENWKKKDK
ncbi:MAG: tRNA (guanosine(37)-N1)-methyltransferase TrmD [Candidatus Pacebacteria bacterium]|nr:tRNA (guanosine(37)-N1)-methyltransferase TrmD [Candidatus Paceibacterota bacterium]